MCKNLLLVIEPNFKNTSRIVESASKTRHVIIQTRDLEWSRMSSRLQLYLI